MTNQRRVAAIGLAALLCGCADAAAQPSVKEVCRALSICDEPVPVPVGVVVLCDASLGSPCSRTRLNREVGAILSYVVARPGSRVQLAMLAADAASTAIVGEQVVPAAHRGSERSRAKAADAFVAAAAEYFDAVAAPVFDAAPIKKSPLFESIAKLAMADTAGLRRTLVVITDAREVSGLGDFECKSIPKNEALFARLRAQHVLEPGLLAGTQVQLVDVEMRPIPGRPCVVDVARQVRIRELWAAALRAAGASSVRVTDGPVMLADTGDDPVNSGGKQ